MVNNKPNVKRRIKMFTICRNNLWKWSIIAIVIMAVIAFVDLINSIGNDSPLYKHIDQSTDYDILFLEDTEGNVTLDLETLNEEHWTREELFQLETRKLLDSIKQFSRQELNNFNNITIRFVTQKTKRVPYTISVNADTLMKNDWAQFVSLFKKVNRCCGILSVL